LQSQVNLFSEVVSHFMFSNASAHHFKRSSLEGLVLSACQIVHCCGIDLLVGGGSIVVSF
jgi:hypothetical protein